MLFRKSVGLFQDILTIIQLLPDFCCNMQRYFERILEEMKKWTKFTTYRYGTLKSGWNLQPIDMTHIIVRADTKSFQVLASCDYMESQRRSRNRLRCGLCFYRMPSGWHSRRLFRRALLNRCKPVYLHLSSD